MRDGNGGSGAGNGNEDGGTGRVSGGPSLTATLARGALGSLRKRGPYTDARLPADRMTRPAVHADARRSAAYARVCGFPAGDRLPPTYPHLLGFPLAMRLMARGDFPFPLLGLVHTDIGIVQHRALRQADRPEIRVHAQGPAPHRRGSTFTMVTTALLDGSEVWHSRSTYLCRHRTPDDTGPDARTDAAGAGGEVRDVPGPLPTSASWTLPAGLGRRYAAVSGDRNPIHLHPLTARPFGFPRPIAHGMWTFARCLAEWGAVDGSLTASARFRAPVPLPGTVTYGQRDGAFELRDGRDPARLHVSGEVSMPSAAG